ncbi:MAG: hypothetical protein JNL28_06645 [Planctomycetes bacterium]|nr:hypothetical protein [Planctomycetota bacterium]
MSHRLLALFAVIACGTGSAPAQVMPFDDCGVMVQGVTCPLLFQDSLNQTWLLSQTGGFMVGDPVRVTGIADPGCFTFCQQGGCISVTAIVPCPTALGTPYCFGDGSGTNCPCSNNSTPGEQRGCLHGLGQGGKLTGAGVAAVSADTAVLHGADMPDGPALYYQGTLATAAGAGTTFGDGLMCATGVIVRLGIKFNSGGASQLPAVGDPALSLQGGVAPGDVRRYQAWYRDALNFCTSATFNLTNGLEISWTN